MDGVIAALAGAGGDQNAAEVNLAHEQRALRGREQQALQETASLLAEYSRWLGESVGQFTSQAEATFGDGILAGPETNGPDQSGGADWGPGRPAADPRSAPAIGAGSALHPRVSSNNMHF